MNITGPALAVVVLAAALAAGCGSGSSSAPCVTNAQVAREAAAVQRDLSNAQNGVPIPAGARWPEAAQLAANPQYSVADGNVAGLYWSWRWQAASDAMADNPLPVCGAS